MDWVFEKFGHSGVEEIEELGDYEEERTAGAIKETIAGLDSIVDLISAGFVGHFPQSGINQSGMSNVAIDHNHTQSQQLAYRGRC